MDFQERCKRACWERSDCVGLLLEESCSSVRAGRCCQLKGPLTTADQFAETPPVADVLVTTGLGVDLTSERGVDRLAAGGSGASAGASLETPENALKPGLTQLHEALTGKSSWTSLPTGYSTETWISVILAGLLGGLVLGTCLGLNLSLRGEVVGGPMSGFWQKAARTMPKDLGYSEADLARSTATTEASIARPHMISVESQCVNASSSRPGMQAGDTVESTSTTRQ